jgi:hypothetical protein
MAATSLTMKMISLRMAARSLLGTALSLDLGVAGLVVVGVAEEEAGGEIQDG